MTSASGSRAQHESGHERSSDENPGEAARADSGRGDRDEAPGERLDRQWTELLSELRVTQTGIQLLAGFLLTLPFESRFTELRGWLRIVYLAAIMFSTLATLFIVAPIVSHRILFREHVKDRLVTVGHALARVGLVLLGATVMCVTTLTFGFLVGSAAGLTAGVVTLLICVVLWLALPLAVGGRRPAPRSYSDGAGPGGR